MPEALKVGIVGAGIGREHLRAYLKLADRYEVAVLCDLDAGRARDIIASEGADPGRIDVIGDFERLLARPDVDIVDVCLPPHLHFEMSRKALEAGKHVVCEKPLATSLKDIDALKVAAERSGRTVFPVFQYRYGPEVRKMRALIEAGLTGKPLVATVETHWNRVPDYYSVPWRGRWSGEHGGAVLGHAIHNHDLLTAILGPVARLSAFVATRVNAIEVEDCAAISLQMESGALATSSVTLGGADDMTRLRFCFEKLTAESDLLPYAPGGGTWRFQAREGISNQAEINDVLASVEPSHVGFTGFFEAMADLLQTGQGDVITLADGRNSVELVAAIYTSARTGTVVDLPLRQDAALYGGWQP